VPEPGDKAPAFTLPDQNGEPVKLSDFKGQTVVLYFYPRADTGLNSVGLR
jgi:thioredoxin-dependent peroxiredoxin